jgi:hypothetical protein
MSPTFKLPPLSHAHSRLPIRPRKIVPPSDISTPVPEKVLSPTPTVSFLKRGRDSTPAGVRPVDETVTASACTHLMRMHLHVAVATIVHTALKSRLNNILSRTYHCVLTDLAKLP